QGLCPDKLYKNTANGEVYGGDLLMNRGIDVGFKGDDFATQVILFEEA
ncbi:MAG: GH36 C-terminal domain-containing protein, partial [Clostridia bacterium]|nr:GH36 C-terminal domain-containing protein [Clostridia bacterium]